MNKGVIIEIKKLPPNTDKILILLKQKSSGKLDNIPDLLSLWRAEKPYVGKKMLLETTKIKNGIYRLNVSVIYKTPPKSNQRAVINAELIINNH